MVGDTSKSEAASERAAALAKRLAETGLNLEQDLRDLVGALRMGGGESRLREILDLMACGQSTRSGADVTGRAAKLRQAIVSVGMPNPDAAAVELEAALRLLPWFRSKVRPKVDRPTRERADRSGRGRGGPGARRGGPPRGGPGGRGRP